MKHRLLIAHRDAEWCDLYRRFLTELGYEVEAAVDGLDCLEKLRRVTPAVLVLDQELLWGGGDGVLAWLREDGPHLEIPVLLMAAAGDGLNTGILKESPIVECLPKPVALTPLLKSVCFAVASRDRRKNAVERRARSSLLKAFHFLG